MDHITIRIVAPTAAQRLNAARVEAQRTARRVIIRQRTRILRTLRQTFAPYLVTDDYGTRQHCWTQREAMTWLPVCSSRAYVAHLPTGRLVAQREVSAS